MAYTSQQIMGILSPQQTTESQLHQFIRLVCPGIISLQEPVMPVFFIQAMMALTGRLLTQELIEVMELFGGLHLQKKLKMLEPQIYMHFYKVIYITLLMVLIGDHCHYRH